MQLPLVSCMAAALAIGAAASAAAQDADHEAKIPMTTVSGGERPGAAAKAVRVIIEDENRDESGPLHVVYSDGTDVIESVPHEKTPETHDGVGSQYGFGSSEIAADKETVGWTENYQICCQSYPVSLVLTLFRSGKIIRRLQQGQMIWSWMFVDGGQRVAVVWGPTHGDFVGDYFLYDVDSGRIVAEASPDERLGRFKRDAPAWARKLEKKTGAQVNGNPP